MIVKQKRFRNAGGPLTSRTRFNILTGMGKSILLVDDSVTVRRHLAGILTGAGHSVVEVESGAKALEQVKSSKFDLVLLDLNLPQLSGFEVLRIIKAGGSIPNVPVLCITGVHREVEDVQKLRQLGAAGYISKECSPEDLLFRVSDVLSKAG